MRIIVFLINIVCLIIIIKSTISIYKSDKGLSEMFKKFDDDFIKKLNALTLHLTPDEALELIHEVVDIPDKYYLGVNSEDILEVTLFESDNNMPNKMGKSIETFTLESYKSNELISFGIELVRYIDKLEKNNE